MKLVLPTVRFHFIKVFRLPDKNILKAEIIRLFKNEAKSLRSLDYVFCSDNDLLQLNVEYLNHDTLTDIITFDLSEGTQDLTGEIYISIDRVKENAELFSAPFRTELRRVIFHGALHLCGYGDQTSSEKREMRKKEDYYLSLS